jgi:hypothetical protein
LKIEDKPPIVQSPKSMIQAPEAKVQSPKATALPCAIIPIDNSDDDLTPPLGTPHPEIPPPKPRRSGRTAANFSIAMMIEQGPKTYHTVLDAEDAGQWKEAIGQEMASIQSHEAFTFVENVAEDASMIGSCSVMGRKLLANVTIDKWKVQPLSRGDLQKPGNYNDITSPVIDSASIRLAIGLPAKHDVEIAILDILTAFLGCQLHETLYMCPSEGEWPDRYGSTRPVAKLNESLLSIKQANREYYEEVFDFIVDHLNLQASIAAPGLFSSGYLGQANGILIPVEVDDIMIMGKSGLVASIASRLYDRFNAAGNVPVPNTFQYLGKMVTHDRSKPSIAINQIGYINRVLDRFGIVTGCRKHSTPMEIGYKPHVIQPELREQSFDASTRKSLVRFFIVLSVLVLILPMQSPP